MSCIRKIKTFKEIKTIKLDELNKDSLEKIIEKIKLSIDQKLIKLKSSFKNLYLWQEGNYLIINDPYICHFEHTDLIKGFNLKYGYIQSQGIKGDAHWIIDPLVELLCEIGETYDYSRVLHLQKPKINAVKYLNNNFDINQKLISVFNKIKKDGYITLQSSRKITTHYYDDNFVFSYSSNWSKNNADKFRKLINDFISKVNDCLETSRQELINGTANLISIRAERMGYEVKTTKTSNKVQLVLERKD